jgi:cholesterol oxidase
MTTPRTHDPRRNPDVVVIGSGFGGAVAACRLAAAGRSVLVLERGRRWEPADYPRKPTDAWVWDVDEPERQNGWIDLRVLDQMWIAQGAGVGGGSLIYANVSIDAKPEVFWNGWPLEINGDVLKPYYERVGAMLKSRVLPDGQHTERLKLMQEAAQAIGKQARFRKVELAVTFNDEWSYDLPNATDDSHSRTWTNVHGRQQGTCVHCGNCDIGCQVRAKNTLDLNYLAAAEKSGAVIEPLCLVRYVSNLGGERWRVHFDRLRDGRRVRETVDARRVILAAGSLGSTEILLRSRDEARTLPNLSPALGHGWSSNGDFLTPAVYESRRVSPTVGPTITGAIDFLDGSEEGARYFVEDGGFPNVIANFVNARSAGRPSFERRFLRLIGRALGRDPLQHVMPWFGQAIDAADGRLYLRSRWYAPWRRELALDWNPDRSEAAVDGMIAMHRKLSEATGGKPLVPATWTVLRNLVTPHPLGGCNMARSPAAGVVNHLGEVFGHPGLYVMDGAIVPRAIGLNPSKTIAALAERAVEALVSR